LHLGDLAGRLQMACVFINAEVWSIRRGGRNHAGLVSAELFPSGLRIDRFLLRGDLLKSLSVSRFGEFIGWVP
jgi:hypothetical protein